MIKVQNKIREVSSFTEGIKLSSKRLGFSVTKACPLRCSHCSVSAEPMFGKTTFPSRFTDKVIAEMNAISQNGIEFIDFTGGEPTIAIDFVVRVSAEAKKNNIKTGIVTAAHWASSKKRALQILERFENIDEWDISTDIYHLDFVPVEYVINAYEALKNDFNRNPCIRVAFHEPFTKEDCELIIKLDNIFGKDIRFQPIGPVGRASEFIQNIGASIDNYDKSPCPSTGILIQPFGVAVSCCAPLSHEDYDHPLRLGNAFTEPITDLIFKWRTNPLLQTIRLWGFEPVIKWLNEANIPIESILHDKTCQTCVASIQDKEICRFIYEKSNEFYHKLSLAASLKKYFDEPWMELVIMNEANQMVVEME